MSETPSSSAPRVVVLGDVMTDIVVRLGMDVAVGSDTPAAIAMHAGGSAANQATWLRVALGHDVHFVGCVGRDPFGALHRAAFARAGVVAHLHVDPVRPTGTVVALVGPSGERSMLTERGANAGLTIDALPADAFTAGRCLVLSGYALLAPNTRPAALAALALARARSMRICVDPASAAPLAAVGPQQFLGWTRGADLCLPNLAEAQLLSGEHDPERAALRLADDFGAVVVKLGASGALWARAGESPVHVAGAQVSVVDTTGAGDAFCAGFLSRWLAGAAPAEALAAGVQLGALAAGRVGARPPGADLLATDT